MPLPKRKYSLVFTPQIGCVMADLKIRLMFNLVLQGTWYVESSSDHSAPGRSWYMKSSTSLGTVPGDNSAYALALPQHVHAPTVVPVSIIAKLLFPAAVLNDHIQ